MLDEEEENTQVQDDNVRPENDDDAMEVDDGVSNSSQATPRRSKNTITYEEFTKIRDKIISKLKKDGCKLNFIFYHFHLCILILI